MICEHRILTAYEVWFRLVGTPWEVSVCASLSSPIQQGKVKLQRKAGQHKGFWVGGWSTARTPVAGQDKTGQERSRASGSATSICTTQPRSPATPPSSTPPHLEHCHNISLLIQLRHLQRRLPIRIFCLLVCPAAAAHQAQGQGELVHPGAGSANVPPPV